MLHRHSHPWCYSATEFRRTLFKAAQGPLHIKVETVGRGSWPCMIAAWTAFAAALSIATMFPMEEFISPAQVPR